MAKRTKLEQDNLRKIAVANAMEKSAERQSKIKNPSGGEIARTQANINDRTSILYSAEKNNTPLSTIEKRRIGITQDEENNLNKVAEDNALKYLTNKKLTQEAKQERVEQELLNSKLPETEDEETITSTTEDTYESQGFIPDTINNLAEKVKSKYGLSEEPTTKEILVSSVDAATSIIGKIYDLAQSVFQGGKPMEQKEAEQTLSQIEGDFSNDINLVKSGLKSYDEVKRNLDRYDATISRLKSTTHGLNRVNLRYFLLHGIDVEERVINAQQNLQDYKVQLELARQNNLVSELRRNYGL